MIDGSAKMSYNYYAHNANINAILFTYRERYCHKRSEKAIGKDAKINGSATK